MRATLSASEFVGWVQYLHEKPADISEVQMSILISSVRNALGGKTSPKDFILSGKGDTPSNGFEAQGFTKPNDADMAGLLRPLKL